MLGTPDDSVWPGFSQLKDYQDKFPKWPKQDIVSVAVVGDLEMEGQSLLRVRIIEFYCILHLYFYPVKSQNRLD